MKDAPPAPACLSKPHDDDDDDDDNDDDDKHLCCQPDILCKKFGP